MENNMSVVSTRLCQSEAALALAQRLGLILAGLAAVVARRFLREPKFVGLIIPLWSWLGRSGRRFARAVSRPAVVWTGTAVARTRAASGLMRVRLPARRAWLVRALGWEAAGYGCQLEALLAEPEMRALLAEVPAAGRILRPLCRMLGVTALEVARPVVAAVRVPRRVRAPRPAAPEVWQPGRAALRAGDLWPRRPGKKRG